MRIQNKTSLQFATTVTSRHPRTPEMVAILVGAFDLVPDERMTFVPGMPGIDTDPISGERYRDDDDERTGELVHPGDFAAFKPHGEVMYLGSCHTPGGEPRTELPVQLRLGDVTKSLRAIGPRVWNAHLVGRKYTEPEAFSTMPVDFAHAFGGPKYDANSVGKGHGTDELPNLEWADGIQSREDRPKPASFGPINPRWPSRASLVGKSYGASWRKHREPYYAEDFDWAYFQAAPPDQRNDGPWKGDEELGLVNLHPNHPGLTSQLPGLRPRVFVCDDRDRRWEISVVLDTVVVEGDRSQVRLTWRGLSEVREDDLSDVKFVLVACELQSDEPRPADEYLEELAQFAADPAGLAAFEKAAAAEDPEAMAAAAMEAAAAQGISVEGPPPIPGGPAGPAGDDPVSKELHDKLGNQQKDVQKKVAEAIAKAEAALKAPVPADGMPEGAAPSLRQAEAQKGAVDLREKMAEQIGSSKADKGSAQKGGSPTKPAARVPLKGPVGKLKESVAAGREEASAALEEAKAKGADVAEAEAELAKLDAVDEALAHPMLAELDPALTDGGREPPEELGPGVDASCCDFEGRDLSGIDLTDANLEKANFTRCRMVGTVLTRARLGEAVLNEANLTGAQLDGADLRDVQASDTIAEGANLAGASLDRAVLVSANLRRAVLDEAHGEQMVVRSTDFSESQGKRLRFERSTFTDSVLDDADWTGAVLLRCRIDEAKARRATLTGAQVTRTSFAGTDMTDAKLSRLAGNDSVWLETTLTRADLSLSMMHRAQLTHAKLDHADLFGADLRNARIDRADLSHATAERANFFSADLDKTKMTGTRFDSANLYDAKFLGAAGHEAKFDGANLTRAKFSPGS